MVDPLALRLANTIRATSSGLTDAFATSESTREWLQTNAAHLGTRMDLDDYLPSEADRTALVELRQNVRAVFAECTRSCSARPTCWSPTARAIRPTTARPRPRAA
ncbi:ABATE domain-containing protein, partial [Nocardia sp. NPDC004722]